jgi:1-acyl-sn-glycerol-3-phosphate acyltransferase
VSLRACRRAVALALSLGVSVFRYWLIRVRGPITLEQRALWMQATGRGALAALGIRCEIQGHPPAQGLVVCNHLSYLDIAILSAVMPCFFVSKVEIDRWPFFGKAARTGGTIFVDRSRRASTASVARQIAERLALPVPVLVFPEGTSSDGATVLRFHSALFEPAIAAGAPVTAAAVRYVFEGGQEERDLCWYDDTHFLSHIWKALGTAGFFAAVTFGEPKVYPDRRTAALSTHDEVADMRALRGVSREPAAVHAE